jgi:hypothetical protein
MSRITSTIITERLGGPPKTWTFFGQCFDAGEQSNLTCAILQQPSRYLFTLKPADGSPGCKYVGFEAIPYFKYRHPELYRRLNAGVAFLEMQNDGFDLQESWRSSNGQIVRRTGIAEPVDSVCRAGGPARERHWPALKQVRADETSLKGMDGMSSAQTVVSAGMPLSIIATQRSTEQMLAQRAAIVKAMATVMRKEIDFGTIPGTPKPTLYKPGSEKILALFNLAATPTAEDLSTPDCIRYRVHVTITHAPSGIILGTGIGEASSAESKYQWRSAVCDAEWNETPKDRRRTKWKEGHSGPYAMRQVRADMEDVANTVLKMAKKRAQVDAVLTVTAASDLFAQDIEDLIDAGIDPAEHERRKPPTENRPKDLKKKAAAPPQSNRVGPSNAPPANSAQSSDGQTITDQQGKRFWAMAMET